MEYITLGNFIILSTIIEGVFILRTIRELLIRRKISKTRRALAANRSQEDKDRDRKRMEELAEELGITILS